MSSYCDNSNAGKFHIPECHLNLIIKSWSHHIYNNNNPSQSRIHSIITDIIIKYAYILPKLLFKISRPITPIQIPFISLPTIDTFNKKYITIKPANLIQGFFGATQIIKDIAYPNKLYTSKTINYSSFLVSSFKQRKSIKRIINDNIDTISTITHPNILKIKETYETSKHSVAYVSKYCQGGSLFDRIISDNHKWTEYDISVIIEQILRGLYVMNNTVNMTHGQLTPSKILFTNTDTLDIKISGFGFGKMMSSLSKTSHFNNTIYYKSPEMIKYNKYNHKSDMYSIGIILYLLIFGRHPFQHINEYNHIGKYETKIILNKIKRGFINKTRNTNKYGYGQWFPNDIKCSNEVKDFISKLLTHKMQKRYCAKEALYHPFITNRNRLEKYIISQHVVDSIKQFHNHLMYKKYIMQLFANHCDNITSEIVLNEMDEESKTIQLNEIIDIVNINMNIKLDKIRINNELNTMGITEKYEIRHMEILDVLKNNYVIKSNDNTRLVLQERYDYYNNGFASVYRVKKLFEMYDTFNQYAKCVIERQEIDSCGMINYEKVLMDLYPDNGYSRGAKECNKNSKCNLKRLPSILIIANETFAR